MDAHATFPDINCGEHYFYPGTAARDKLRSVERAIYEDEGTPGTVTEIDSPFFVQTPTVGDFNRKTSAIMLGSLFSNA